ncbi:MAG: ion transporter [Deltaproteobacteria bacterium]|nr:ion transporter [Deltaproteobacteria bacterium]MDQ3295661.1 ion transporter [Myxococcota bacterium]
MRREPSSPYVGAPASAELLTPPPAPSPDSTESQLLARRVETALELPMIVLGLVWLALVVAELVSVLPSWLEHVGTAIWAVFVADFALRLSLAPDRSTYLRKNWLTAIALLVPALRVFRVARVFRILRATRAVRGVRAFRLVTTFGRAKRSIHALLASRNALGYVIGLTLAVVLLGAAGLYAFEERFDNYPFALWWTAMLIMTMGTEGWPVSVEGRALSLLLAFYGFAVFGYITASIASWFVGRNQNRATKPMSP